MVPVASAQSCAVGSPSSPGPNSTTSSPAADRVVAEVDARTGPCRPGRRSSGAGRRAAPGRPLVASRGHPVGVPERHQGQGGLAAGRVDVPVGDAAAGRDPLDQRDRARSVIAGRSPMPLPAGHRGQPVDRDARADQVEVRVRAGSAWPPSWPGAAAAGRRRAAGPPSTASANAATWRAMVGCPGASAYAKWLQMPTTSTSPAAGRLGRRGRPASGQSAGRRAAAGQPGVDLQVHPGRAAGVPGRRGDLADRPGRARGQVDVRGDRRRRRSSPGAISQDSTGAVIPARRSASASSRNATPSQLAPPASAARAAGHQAVPVPVGLDHRHHLGGASGTAAARRCPGSRRGRRPPPTGPCAHPRRACCRTARPGTGPASGAPPGSAARRRGGYRCREWRIVGDFTAERDRAAAARAGPACRARAACPGWSRWSTGAARPRWSAWARGRSAGRRWPGTRSSGSPR